MSFSTSPKWVGTVIGLIKKAEQIGPAAHAIEAKSEDGPPRCDALSALIFLRKLPFAVGGIARVGRAKSLEQLGLGYALKLGKIGLEAAWTQE